MVRKRRVLACVGREARNPAEGPIRAPAGGHSTAWRIHEMEFSRLEWRRIPLSIKDSNVSFNVAAKHLFRHLHEPRALRRNPLVRRFFEDPHIGGLGHDRERAVLYRIHQLVRDGAEKRRDTDLLAGKDERALRRHLIITQQCLKRRPVREVAAELGISYGYCYQERSEICRRVARYIFEHDDPPPVEYLLELDEFQLSVDRATHRIAFFDMRAAFHECDNLIRMAPSAHQKIEALRITALVSIDFGDFKKAADAYIVAQTLYAERLAADLSTAADVSRARIDLVGFELAACRANKADGLRMAQRASARLELIQATAPAHVKDLYVESLYALGAAFCSLGDLDKSYDFTASAEAHLCQISSASLQLRTRVMVAIWRLRNHLVLSSKGCYPARQRLTGLTTAFKQAYAAGLFSEAAAALATLTAYYADAGNAAESLRAARFAVLLAKQHPNERIWARTSIRVATTLLSTQYWEHALALLLGTQRLDPGDVYHRELIAYFAAAHAFQLHSFRDAWTLASVEVDGYRKSGILPVRRMLIAAAAAHELDRRRDARAVIEGAISAAEGLGSAPTLKNTYSVAAKVTGDPRFKRRADEIANVLTA
jgi:tetratricopeptide (TPR) repeat protein